jgi:GNAT superfamily N-acetyltransferase
MQFQRQWARLRRLSRRLLSLVFLKITDVVYVLDLKDYRPAKAPPRNMIQIMPLTVADRERLTDAFGEVKADALIQRLKTCYGVIGIYQGKAAGYSWMTAKPRHGEGVTPFFYDISPKTGWFYCFDTYVAPSARGVGLATQLKCGLIEEVQRRGGHFCLATHDITNVSIIHVSEKLGFKLQGHLYYRRILGATRQDTSGLPEGVRP